MGSGSAYHFSLALWGRILELTPIQDDDDDDDDDDDGFLFLALEFTKTRSADLIYVSLLVMATASDAKLWLWRDYSRRYLDREQTPMEKRRDC